MSSNSNLFHLQLVDLYNNIEIIKHQNIIRQAQYLLKKYSRISYSNITDTLTDIIKISKKQIETRAGCDEINSHLFGEDTTATLESLAVLLKS